MFIIGILRKHIVRYVVYEKTKFLKYQSQLYIYLPLEFEELNKGRNFTLLK